MKLVHEIAVYCEHLASMLDHEGQYVVVCRNEIEGFFDSYESALRAGYMRFGLVPFLVQKVSRQEPVEYFPRDLR